MEKGPFIVISGHDLHDLKLLLEMCIRDRDNLSFVTARGWEDLSQILKGYEALQVPVTEALVSHCLLYTSRCV